MHPCRSCGACCAAFRVRFPARLVADEAVPAELTAPWIPDHLEMRRVSGVCIAHEGTVGTDSTCRIYARRPEPCRSFTASWERGEANASCDRARAERGLPPLTPADYQSVTL